MQHQAFPTLALLLALAAPAPARAQESSRPDGMRFVPNVAEQFAALTPRPDALGFHIGASPDPSTCRHYQGLARIDAADGTPYFLLTRSGNRPEQVPAVGCPVFPGENGRGNLIVVRMGSRDTHGERLRSNRLQARRDIGDTVPPEEDTVVTHVEFDGTSLPDYGHPGGMQVVGHMLALTLEHPYEPHLPRAAVMFFDVGNPEMPVFRSWFSTEAEMGGAAGLVGITPLPNDRYLMVVAGGKNERLFFYRSTLSDLSSTSLSWEFVGTTPGPAVGDPHQTLHFLRQGDINGRLYLAGARGRLGSPGYIDLYRVVCGTPDCAPGEPIQLFTRTEGQLVSAHPTLGGSSLASLAAASGFHVSPSGELILYATEHDNDGPRGTVKAAEWRHVEMVRPHSPTLVPRITIGGPYQVDEGAQLELTGVAKPPITRAWVQLYSGIDFAGHSVVVDYEDRHLDDFLALWRLEPTPPSNVGFSDNAASWRWFAPPGCSIVASDVDGTTVRARRTLVGTGADADLTAILDDLGRSSMNRTVDSVHFDWCEAYYDGPFRLHWDVDRDGVHETTGYSVPFTAGGALDGPALVEVPVEARHDLGGPVAPAIARIEIRNVAPRVTATRLFNSAGQQLAVQTLPGTTPSVLTDLPVTVEADFVDPGVNDRQTASVNWGDGVIDAHTAFPTFDDASGDGRGTLSQAHRYTGTGLRQISITVRDDDGGTVRKVIALQVIGPIQAVELALVRLDTIIAATSDEEARQHLTQARQALAGSHSRSTDGALQLITAGRFEEAIARLNDAIASITDAQVASAAPVVAVLQLAIDSLSAKMRA